MLLACEAISAGCFGRRFGGEADCWSVVAEPFSGAVVELPGDVVDVDVWVDCQIGSLREILTDEPVVVFVRASLPRAGAFSEEDRDSGRGVELLGAWPSRRLGPR